MARRKTKTTTGLQNHKAKVNITITPESKSTLDKIASDIGLSRSAFFEGMLNGSISLSSQQAQQLVSLKSSTGSSETKIAHAPLEVNIINDLNEQDNDSSTEKKQEQIEVQQEKISALENEINKKENTLVETDKINKYLQEKFDSQISMIASLKAKLEEAKTVKKSTDKNKKLQDLLNSKDETIKQLNQDISRLKKEITNDKNQDTSLSNESADLQEQVNLKNKLIEELKQQITSQQQQIQLLQTKANPVIVTNQTNPDLEHLNRQQKDTITRLEKRIAELQTVASIGTQTLNKWRSKMYR